MKSHRKELWLEVPRRRQLINITPEVEAALAESQIREGICLVNAMHISASVFINDDESGLHADIEKWLEKLAPEKLAPEKPHDHGPRGGRRRDGGKARFRALGTDLLRGIRRKAPKARPGQDHRGIICAGTAESPATRVICPLRGLAGVQQQIGDRVAERAVAPRAPFKP